MTFDTLWSWATETPLLGIPLARWATALAVGVAAYVLLTLLLRVVLNRARRFARRSTTVADDTIVDVLGATRFWLLAIIALLIGLDMLELPARWQSRVSHLWFVVLVIQIALWTSRALKLVMNRQLERHVGVPQASASATLLSWGLQTALWTTVMLAVLSNLGVNITALVTSLGVGGIAVALAVQNILGDLFASLAIALDKPFEVGDAIAVGSISGTVERVGLKTTRLRAPSGEQIVMSNADLLKNAVSNYKRQTQRRIVFKFAVEYGTPADKAREIPALVQKIIEAEPELQFDRAHLQSIGDNALQYEVVYIVQKSDYTFYMNAQQRIYLAIIEALQAQDIGISVPRTVLVSPPAAPQRP